MKRALVFLCLVSACLVSACRPIPPPEVLARADEARVAPAIKQARAHAPTAYALAEKLRKEAHQAFDAGDTAGAQILAERALAAYQQAVALARAVRAEEQRVDAVAEAGKAEKRLSQLDIEHQRAAADIAALENRLEALRGAEGAQPSGPAGAERERARAEAVASLRVQARLLCASARLLVATGKTTGNELAQAERSLAELDALMGKASAAPIDHATRARADCLRALTLVRRAAEDKTRATGTGDALLDALSKAQLGTPRRDDRGVVVTLRDAFAGEALSGGAEKTLDAIAKITKAHPGFPMLVVLHQTRALDAASERRWRERGDKLVAALKQRVNLPVGGPEIAGVASPLVDPKGKQAARNERVEIVFVTPQPM
ncbi:MAG TPA: hypothetical protein VFB62_19900 [Polyangiaceae bacterium]|nr:hypothetical protein [Polyangiaceae bacterium]